MITVQVLMAVYNGAAYLRQQIDSIMRQQGVNVSLLIRDDGSSDGTIEILREYETQFQNISVYTGERKGAAGSFFDLILHVGFGSRYYAFADQDDVWLADKLLRAVSMLEKETYDVPLLYAGKVICASEDLNRLHAFPYQYSREPSFGNALLENICMGCTEVFNECLLAIVKGHIPPDGVMHDWWMYLTASYFGIVVYDKKAFLLYRQHGNNEVGMKEHWFGRWVSRLRRIRRMQHQLSRQAVVFRDVYKGQSVRDERLSLLCSCKAHFLFRIRILCNKNIYRQNPVDDVLCRILILIGFL